MDTQHYVVYYERDQRLVPVETGGAPAASHGVPSPSPAGPASRAQASPTSIEEIGIERHCFGCENQYKLTFRRDGTATLMTTGVLSGGAFDHTCRGSVTPEAFAAVANLVHKEGYFDLNDVYLDPHMGGDGGLITTAVTDGQRKTVLDGEGSGPPNLKAIENAIDALGEKISWTGRP